MPVLQYDWGRNGGRKMYRVASRALAMWVLVAIALGGLGFFGYEYCAKAGDWVMASGNPHVYDENSTIALGAVYDRDGIFLVSLANGKTYGENALLRAAMLHWTGDRPGNVQVSMLAHYGQALAGFHLVDGLYDYDGLGGDLTLTLSARVQMAALQALGDRKGTVALYNYRTGQLLCAVSTPTFDPENPPDLQQDTTEQYEGVYWNRFLQSVYIPGSIFKLVTTAAALEALTDMESRSFTCTGRLEFGVDAVTCERAHGTMQMKEALMRSCNCAYAQIGLLLGGETMEAYVAQFGVTEAIRFDGITTASGHYRGADTAAVHLAWSAVGQYEDQINPCAFLTFVGAIANGGQGVTPYVVESVQVGPCKSYQAASVQRQRILSEETAATLRAYMRNNVVSNYGADRFAGLTVCAKSGTAQTDGNGIPNAMFVGFATEEAYPIAFFVAVEEAGYGTAVCVPILGQVLEACKSALDAGA